MDMLTAGMVADCSLTFVLTFLGFASVWLDWSAKQRKCQHWLSFACFVVSLDCFTASFIIFLKIDGHANCRNGCQLFPGMCPYFFRLCQHLAWQVLALLCFFCCVVWLSMTGRPSAWLILFLFSQFAEQRNHWLPPLLHCFFFHFWGMDQHTDSRNGCQSFPVICPYFFGFARVWLDGRAK